MRGIDGLKGREPVGAVLSVGVKGDRGNPVEKDRFHLLEPMPDGQNRRHHHPRFGPFNTAAASQRRTVFGQLVHRTEAECWGYQLKAFRAPGQPTHPRKLPFCEGDGKVARRYMGNVEGEHRFDEIVCPHDRCEFRQRPRTGRGVGPSPCKPWGKLLFRVLWRNGTMPTSLIKWTTGSWNSIRNAMGLFEQLQSMAEMVLGPGRAYSLGGFEFEMTLGEGTNPEENTRFPVVSFAPHTDPIEFFMAQVDRRERVDTVMGPVNLIEAPPTVVTIEQEGGEQDGVDYMAHMPGVGQ